MSINIVKAVILTAMTTLLLSATSVTAQEIDPDELERKVREKLEELFDEQTQDEFAEHLQDALQRLQDGLEGAGGELGNGLTEAFEDLERDLSEAGNEFGERLSEKVEELLEDDDFDELRQAMENGDFRSLLRGVAAKPSYYVGIQLNIEDEKITVAGVMADSPAAEAGFESGDVIQKVNQTEIKTAQDLMEAVRNSEGKRLTIRVERDGRKREIKVTPEERSIAGEFDIDAIDELLGELSDTDDRIDPELLQNLIEQFGVEFPSKHIPRATLPKRLPPNVSMTIQRSGSKPAKITISRDDQVWKITEKQVDTLPKDLQPIVRQALGLSGDDGLSGDNREEAEEIEVEKDHAAEDARDEKIEDLQKRLRELQEQMKDLLKDE